MICPALNASMHATTSAQASKATQEAAKQLHLLYLANDVLFKALPSRPTGSTPEADAVAEAFCPRLGTMLRHAFLAGGQTDEVGGPPTLAGWGLRWGVSACKIKSSVRCGWTPAGILGA